MGGSHSHTHSVTDVDEREVISRLARGVLVGLAAVLGGLTLVAVWLLWPEQSSTGSVPYFGPGVTQQDAEVVAVSDTCPVIVAGPDGAEDPSPPDEFPEHCNELTVRVTTGPDRGAQVVVQSPPEATRAGLVSGDGVRVIRIPGAAGQEAVYGYVGIDRSSSLLLMTGLFLVIVAAVARLRGILAVVGLVFAGIVIWQFMLPALLGGSSGWAVAVSGSSLIMFVVLYLAHGLSLRTTVALLGTLIGVAVTSLVGSWGIAGANVSGLAGEASDALFARTTNVDFSALVLCAVIIAGLGVLNDVTITQASAVFELRAAGPQLTRRELFRSGMRIGRDHIASTIYTIAFAYAGTSLALLALVSILDRPLLDLLLDEGITEEIVRTFASGIGLILAVPITTVLAVTATARPVVTPDGGAADNSVE